MISKILYKVQKGLKKVDKRFRFCSLNNSLIFVLNNTDKRQTLQILMMVSLINYQ